MKPIYTCCLLSIFLLLLAPQPVFARVTRPLASVDYPRIVSVKAPGANTQNVFQYRRHGTHHRIYYHSSSQRHYYTNSSRHRVQSPTRYDGPPNGATAQCRDMTYSFSQHRRGTCSHHGGVRRWLQ